MAGERDATNGELSIQLQNLSEQVAALSKSIVTRELFEAKFDGQADWVRRLEQDVKDSERFTATARAELETRLQAQITYLRTTQDGNQKDVEAAGKARVNMWVTGAITIAGAILVKLFFPTIP